LNKVALSQLGNTQIEENNNELRMSSISFGKDLNTNDEMTSAT